MSWKYYKNDDAFGLRLVGGIGFIVTFLLFLMAADSAKDVFKAPTGGIVLEKNVGYNDQLTVTVRLCDAPGTCKVGGIPVTAADFEQAVVGKWWGAEHPIMRETQESIDDRYASRYVRDIMGWIALGSWLLAWHTQIIDAGIWIVKQRKPKNDLPRAKVR